jgi:sugar-specific transcriptional regulator TrmB
MDSMANHPGLEALVQLGLTGLEAEIYLHLLQNPPSTGYKIAQGAGKTNANTYKALESLLAKGAALLDDGDPRIWRAVPPEELLGQLRRGFDRAERQAEAALARLTPAPADHRVYQITSREQLFERARRMLEECRWIALLDLYPALVGELREAVIATAARGPRVTLKSYAPEDFGFATVIERQNGQELVDAMPCDHVSLVVDGREYLSAWLARDSGAPVQAVWTASPVLAYEAHGSLTYELILTDLQQAIWDGADNAALTKLLARHDYLHPIRSRGPVYREYLAALGQPRPAEPESPGPAPRQRATRTPKERKP